MTDLRLRPTGDLMQLADTTHADAARLYEAGVAAVAGGDKAHGADLARKSSAQRALHDAVVRELERRNAFWRAPEGD